MFQDSTDFWNAFSLEKIPEMLEEVVVSWQEVSWMWRMRQNFVGRFIQLLKRSLCHVWLSVVMEKNWGFFCWVVLASSIAVLGASHRFVGHTSQMEWFCQGSENHSRSDRQQITKQWSWPFLSKPFTKPPKVWLWEVLWSFFSVQPLSWLSLVV